MKNALLFTGAAARISQEVAILDKLIEQRNLKIDPDTTMLAGYSSGALNIAAINACFRKSNPLAWNEYYKEELLFEITTKKVFKKKKFVPFNTKPLQSRIQKFCDKAGFNQYSDFPFHTYVLAFSLRRLKVIWTNNKNQKLEAINPVDLLMGTSAIPILFPYFPIRNNNGKNKSIPSGKYLDGGVGGSFKRFKKQLRNFYNEHGELEELYIISPMREISTEEFDEFNKLLPTNDVLKLHLKDFKLLKIFLSTISMNGFDTFIRQFNNWNKRSMRPVAQNIYVCIPQLENNYPILNFNKQKEQYDTVCKWANENPDSLAMPIAQYVDKIEKSDIYKFVESRISKWLTWKERWAFRRHQCD